MNHVRLCRLALFALLLVPAIAFAHAFPQSSQPAKDAVLTQAPTSVSITFNSDVQPLFNKLVVKDAAGKVVSKGQAKVSADHRILSVDLGTLAPGQYHVYWHVTAKDGHHTHGEYTFTLNEK